MRRLSLIWRLLSGLTAPTSAVPFLKVWQQQDDDLQTEVGFHQMMLFVAVFSAGEQVFFFFFFFCWYLVVSSLNRYQTWPFLTQGGLHLLKVKLKQQSRLSECLCVCFIDCNTFVFVFWFNLVISATLEADEIVVDKRWRFRLFIYYSIERKVNLQIIRKYQS